MNDDTRRGLGTLIGHGHVSNNGKLSELCHVIVTLNLVAEEIQEEQDSKGQESTNGESQQQDDDRLRTDTPLKQRLVKQFALVGGSCQCDTILLAFLEEQQIKARMNVLLATYLVEHALLDRCTGDASLVLGILRLNALTVDVGRAACL